MRAQRRTFVGPVAISVSLHALLVAVLLLGGRFSWPAPPIPIELVPSQHRSTQRIGEPRRAEPRPPAATGAHQPGSGAKPKPKTPPPPEPPATQDLRPYAPDDANLVVLLRTDKLRKSPHRAVAEQLLGALPDYSRFVAGSGLSVIDDFESLLIATSNPRDGFVTFLAARFVESPKIHAIAGRPMHSSDPRVFRFPAPGLAVLLRPEEALQLEEGRDAGADSHARWVRQLAQFDQAAKGDNGPAIVATLSDVPSLVRFGLGLPTPQALAIALTADGAPLVHLKAVFLVDGDAERMEREWPDILRRYRTATRLFGLDTALDGLTLTRTGAQLDVEGRIPEAQLKMGLALVASLLPQVTQVTPPVAAPPVQNAAPPADADLGIR